MKLRNELAINNPIYTRGISFTKVMGIVITSAQIKGKITDYVRSYNTWTLFAKCPHFIIDTDGTIYQLLPENYQGKYCGKTADKKYIQIIMREPEGSGRSNGKLVIPDLYVAKKNAEKAYEALLELCLSLCTRHKIDPSGLGNVVSRPEANEMGISSKGFGVDSVWRSLDMSYSMLCFRKELADSLCDGRGYYHEGIDYSYVFNPEYYLSTYPDLARTVGTTHGDLFRHFISQGMRECRKGNRDFDVLIYKNNNPDLVFGIDWPRYYHHYCVYGRLENRRCI